MDEEEEFEYYRDLYVKALNEKIFPWKSAYYYYETNIHAVDIMSFEEFRETVQLESLSSDDISGSIYAALDTYYVPTMLLAPDNKLLKMI